VESPRPPAGPIRCPQDAAAEPRQRSERRQRIIHEARAASALNHPNIAHVYDIGETEGALYIAMEYVAGHSLERHIAQKKLTRTDALKCAAQVADAMAAAHAAGIVHGISSRPTA
jgi:serine/threonine protein kinase